MKPATHNTFAERTGRMLARLWSGFVRLDRKACGWLVAQGLPAGLAKTILWVVKLAVLGVLLYSAFWLAVLLVFAAIAACVVRNADADDSSDDDEPQWRNRLDGYRKWSRVAPWYFHSYAHGQPPASGQTAPQRLS